MNWWSTVVAWWNAQPHWLQMIITLLFTTAVASIAGAVNTPNACMSAACWLLYIKGGFWKGVAAVFGLYLPSSAYSYKKQIAMVLAVGLLLVALPSQAQTLPNAPSVTASVNAVGAANSVGSLIRASYGFTSTDTLAFDSYQFPGLNESGYFGTDLYNLPLCGVLANTTLPCDKLQVQAQGSLGVWRVTPTGGTSQNYFGGCIGANANYDPTGQGKFGVNIGMVSECRMPILGANGLTQSHWETVYSAGIFAGFGSNSGATELKRQAALTQQARKTVKMAKAACVGWKLGQPLPPGLPAGVDCGKK